MHRSAGGSCRPRSVPGADAALPRPHRPALGVGLAAGLAVALAGCISVETHEAGDAGGIPLLELRRDLAKTEKTRSAFVVSLFGFEAPADGWVYDGATYTSTPVSGTVSASFARAAVEFADPKASPSGMDVGVSLGLAAMKDVRFSYPWGGADVEDRAGEWHVLGLLADMGFFVRVKLTPGARLRFETHYVGGPFEGSWADSLVAAEFSSSPRTSVILGLRAVEGEWLDDYDYYSYDGTRLEADTFSGATLGLSVKF